MLEFIQNKKQTIQKEFERLLSEQAKTKIISNQLIRSVAILTTDSIALQNDLKSQVKKVLNVENIEMYRYQKFDKKNPPSEEHFTEKSIGRKGKIVDSGLQEFLNKPFDLLITYFHDKNQCLEYATLYSKANFKAGFANVNPNLFDLEIAVAPNNFNEFHAELKKYLTILKKVK